MRERKREGERSERVGCCTCWRGYLSRPALAPCLGRPVRDLRRLISSDFGLNVDFGLGEILQLLMREFLLLALAKAQYAIVYGSRQSDGSTKADGE
jgi:hypothetical protein